MSYARGNAHATAVIIPGLTVCWPWCIGTTLSKTGAMDQRCNERFIHSFAGTRLTVLRDQKSQKVARDAKNKLDLGRAAPALVGGFFLNAMFHKGTKVVAVTPEQRLYLCLPHFPERSSGTQCQVAGGAES